MDTKALVVAMHVFIAVSAGGCGAQAADDEEIQLAAGGKGDSTSLTYVTLSPTSPRRRFHFECNEEPIFGGCDVTFSAILMPSSRAVVKEYLEGNPTEVSTYRVDYQFSDLYDWQYLYENKLHLGPRGLVEEGESRPIGVTEYSNYTITLTTPVPSPLTYQIELVGTR